MSTKMTQADLYDWIRGVHKCEQQIIPGTARVIQFINRKYEKKAYLKLPIDDRPVSDHTVYLICTRLAIPIPTHAHKKK